MPDQNINVTVQRKGGCCSGCGTALVVLLGLGLMIEAWQSVNLLGRVGLIAGTLTLLGLIAWAYDAKDKRKAKAAPPRPATPKPARHCGPPASEIGPVVDPYGGWPGPPVPPATKLPIARPQKPQRAPTVSPAPSPRKPKRGRSAPTLGAEDVAAVIDAYRRSRLQQGADPHQVDGEVRLRFGRELEQFELDETGTRPLFDPPGGSKP